MKGHKKPSLSKDNNSKIYNSTTNENFVPYKLKTSQKIYRGFKRVMDFFIALIALIVLIPVFLVTSIAIVIDSKGHPFFSHKRIGKNKKTFSCMKFRSMTKNARHDIAGYQYQEVNSYITKVGKFIRATSIDELPQLYNVLIGNMSLIGYRPSQPSEKELNDEREKYNMYQIRPGITGWAQVNGRDILASDPILKARYDAYYLEHFSLKLDIKILFLTIKKVIFHADVKEGVVKKNKPIEVEQQVETSVKETEDENTMQPQ